MIRHPLNAKKLFRNRKGKLTIRVNLLLLVRTLEGGYFEKMLIRMYGSLKHNEKGSLKIM